MSEVTLQWVQVLKLLTLAGFSTLYGFGGISGKWKRRIIGSLLLTSAIVGFTLWMHSFNWWLLLCALLYFGSLSLGYGADNLNEKLIKRSLFGLANSLACLPLAIIQSAWLILGLHIVLVTSISVVLGVWNPTKSARAEETIIGFSIGFFPLLGMI